jgi:hypothetical protein
MMTHEQLVKKALAKPSVKAAYDGWQAEFDKLAAKVKAKNCRFVSKTPARLAKPLLVRLRGAIEAALPGATTMLKSLADGDYVFIETIAGSLVSSYMVDIDDLLKLSDAQAWIETTASKIVGDIQNYAALYEKHRF